MSPMAPPKLNRTVTCTSRVPCSGEPSGRTVGHLPVDENVAATPSAIDEGLDHRRGEGGVHTPVRSQCAGVAPALGTAKDNAAAVANIGPRILTAVRCIAHLRFPRRPSKVADRT